MTEQEEKIKLIWYQFGIRSKELLQDMAKIQLDNINTLDFECLQLACETAIKNLEENLKSYLYEYPDC